ncbi:hypothetical protein [Amycolatopsis sp. H20-H5]|uniref:hypothetical protein n=1 Tax=Amycolatopsis sp. H20-H5 TaxID=3046309 RepID=UPI002DB56965|nr:hypothetical protein [Amycolatopsis sp. H20-H5]MEC3982706.1 hypothetical protein [Amycolatopsis sp. H20-H5]
MPPRRSPAAFAIGVSYVAGMVAPLALAALVQDKLRERATLLLTDRAIVVRLGGRRLVLGSAVSGGLMIVMSVLAVVLALTGPGMPSGGWQTEISAWLRHLSSVVLNNLSWILGWVVVVVLALGFALFVRRAVRVKVPPRDRYPIDSQIVEENRREQDQR